MSQECILSINYHVFFQYDGLKRFGKLALTRRLKLQSLAAVVHLNTLFHTYGCIQFNHDLSTGRVPGTLYGMSESGWMDQEIFYNWFSNQFLKHAITCRLLLLMLDRHSSDFMLELVQSAADNDVTIFCLPPHMIADSQHLDISCFFLISLKHVVTFYVLILAEWSHNSNFHDFSPSSTADMCSYLLELCF